MMGMFKFLTPSKEEKKKSNSAEIAVGRLQVTVMSHRSLSDKNSAKVKALENELISVIKRHFNDIPDSDININFEKKGNNVEVLEVKVDLPEEHT